MDKNNRVIFMSGAKLDLIILDPARHLESGQRFIMDPEINRYLQSGRFPVTAAQEKAWFEKDRKNDIVLAIESKDGRHIGNIGLHQIDWINRKATLGILIGAKDLWGQGLATEAEMLIIRHGFSIGLNKILADVYAPNLASARVLIKIGFRQIGTFKRHIFKNSDWHDQNSFELLREDFKH